MYNKRRQTNPTAPAGRHVYSNEDAQVFEPQRGGMYPIGEIHNILRESLLAIQPH